MNHSTPTPCEKPAPRNGTHSLQSLGNMFDDQLSNAPETLPKVVPRPRDLEGLMAVARSRKDVEIDVVIKEHENQPGPHIVSSLDAAGDCLWCFEHQLDGRLATQAGESGHKTS